MTVKTEKPLSARPEGEEKKESPFKEFCRRFFRNKQAVIGLVIFVMLVFVAVFADVLVDYDNQVIKQDIVNKRQPPSSEHLMGTDDYGRDILARVIYGTRISLTIGLTTVACAMAAAAACQLFGGTPAQIEYAAEMGLEHHLGLTCDPVCGLVQVPCIERNAIAAARAFDANAYATLSDGSHMVSFDKVVEVMNETGHNLPSLYRETSTGGLAKRYNDKK